MMPEKTPESPLDSKEIQRANLKGNQPWIFIGRTDAEAETLVFWSSDVNSWLTGKDPDAGKDWGQKEKRASEDEMAGWHHWCKGHELGQTPGDSEGHGGLECCSPWGRKESDTTGQLNNNSTHIHVHTPVCAPLTSTSLGPSSSEVPALPPPPLPIASGKVQMWP